MSGTKGRPEFSIDDTRAYAHDSSECQLRLSIVTKEGEERTASF